MEIKNTTSKRDERTKIKKRKGAASVGNDHKSFAHEVNNSIAFKIEGTIDKLLDDLKDQEKRFIDAQSLYELNKYKALIQKILKTILDESIETKSMRRSRRHRNDTVLIANIINDKLLEITQAITKKNKAFNLLKTIEEIRGLVFDLRY